MENLQIFLCRYVVNRKKLNLNNSVKFKNDFFFKKKNKKTKRYKKMLKELQAVSRGEDLDSWKRVTRASNNGIICSIW